MDIIVGILKSIILKQKEDNIQDFKRLKLAITSATIDDSKFVSYFGELSSSVIKISGRTFPIQIRYTPGIGNENYIEKAINCVFDHIHREYDNKGDILVFLTGQEEVEHAVDEASKRILDSDLQNDYIVLGLYGKQPVEEQQKIFEETSQQKIIFSTNIAETSLTIQKVCCVIDTGLEKEAYFDHQRNMTVIRTTQISRNSAIQRAGRAGRTAPGICYRLYSKEEFEEMNTDATPEILKASLGTTILTLSSMNIDIQNFDWIDKPPQEDIESTKKKLIYLEALTEDNKITELGKFIANNQIDPCIGKLLFYGKNTSEEAKYYSVLLASILSISMWWYGGSKTQKEECTKKKENFIQSLQMPTSYLELGDIITDVFVFKEWLSINIKNAKKWCATNSINSSNMYLCNIN